MGAKFGDSLSILNQGLARQLDEGKIHRDKLWARYWEGRRMVTVPENRTDDVTITGNTFTNTGGRLFPSFPNLAPKVSDPAIWENPAYIRVSPNETSPTRTGMTDVLVERRGDQVIRDCIARLKSARAKESTNRNLSTLLAVVVKVQKDLETLVGDDWKHQDAAVESQVTRDDRSL